jgi:membrane-associated phospholipid phosphatase
MHGGEGPIDQGRLLPEVSGKSTLQRSWFSLLPLLFLLCGVAALAIDCPLAKWCLDRRRSDFEKDLLQVGACFGNAIGAALAILAAFDVMPERRRAIPRVVAITLGAGIAADLLKLLVVRIRPHHFDFAGSVWQTFGEWLPLGTRGSSNQSFPSGHTAVVVGLAIAMIWLYPRGLRLFSALAVLAACQRVAAGVHYLSDVFFGAAVGSMVAVVCLSVGRLPAWFSRWESSQRPKSLSDHRNETVSTAAYP